MLECLTCGAAGADNFSTNFFGELVCDLCGTQSTLQSQNETQEVDDPSQVQSLRRTTSRKKRKRGRESQPSSTQDSFFSASQLSAETEDEHVNEYVAERFMDRRQRLMKMPRAQRFTVAIEDCVLASQTVLQKLAQCLVDRCGFPNDYLRVVRELWFTLLEMWETKSPRPLIDSFEVFLSARGRTYDNPDLQTDALEQWDESQRSDREQQDTPRANTHAAAGHLRYRHHLKELTAQLGQFQLLDLLCLLVLGARVLNLGLLPCDFTHWIQKGELPAYNCFQLLPVHLQRKVDNVMKFFDLNANFNPVTTAYITMKTHTLYHHLELKLPPLNAPLAANNLAENLGFPQMVLTHLQWLLSNFNVAGDLPEAPVSSLVYQTENWYEWADGYGDDAILVDNAVAIGAHVVVAVKLCPNWHEFIYHRVHNEFTLPDRLLLLDTFPRDHVEEFVRKSEVILNSGKQYNVPRLFDEHVAALKEKYHKDGLYDKAEMHELFAYPATYHQGTCIEDDAAIKNRLEKLKTEAEKRDEDAYFYPVYRLRSEACHHAAHETLLSVVAEYIDTPIAVLAEWVHALDQRIEWLAEKQVMGKDQQPVE